MEEWEKNLPPRARERLSKIEVTAEDKQRIKLTQELKPLLSKLYQQELTPEDFANQLKNYPREKRDFIVKEAQSKLIDSLSLQISSQDFKRRGKCILILEKLKPKGKSSSLKEKINSLGDLIKRYMGEKNRLFNQLKEQVKDNPKSRMRQVNTEQGRGLVQLSPEEAVLSSPQWKQFISRHETMCRSQFSELLETLKQIIT